MHRNGGKGLRHPAPGHSPGSPSHNTATDQAPPQQAVPITHAGP
jgi:hypothetical protein